MDHLSDEQIQQYRRRELAPEERLTVIDHTVHCAECRQRLAASGSMEARLDSLRADLRMAARTPVEHLPPEQLAAYMDDSLDPAGREVVEGHMEICPQCKADMEDLLAFKQEMRGARIKRKLSPSSAWFAQRLRLPSSIPAWGIGLAVAALVLLVLSFVVRPLRREVTDPRKQSKTVQPTNQSLQKQMAEAQPTQGVPPKTSLEPPQEIVKLRDGNRWVTLDVEGQLRGLETLSSTLQHTITTALTEQRVVIPNEITELVGRQPMGGGGEGVPFRLLSPVGTAALTNRPMFLWRPLKDATQYRVVIFDDSDHEVAASEPLATTQWTVPRPLSRGQVYSWQVIATLPDGREVISPAPPAPSAKMKIADQETAQKLTLTKRTYANSRIVLGVLYAQDGLLSRAEREFQALLRDNPESPVARKLLQSVQEARR